MTTRAVLGLQWGDEGKGKVVTRLAAEADYVVRFQGGGNAGHTVYVDGEKLVLHHVPCGIIAPQAKCLLTQGMVLDVPTFFKEIERVEALGIQTEGRIKVSDRIHIVAPYHKKLDQMREASKGGITIGTTGRGIGNTYADRAMRFGVRGADLLDKAWLRELVTSSLLIKNKQLADLNGDQFDVEDTVNELFELGERLAPYLCDTAMELATALDKDADVLFEGAQAAMLDIDNGTYPYVTSSTTSASGISAGTGVNVGTIDECIGVAKAYCTRVGRGCFPTEIDGEVGQKIAEKGGEFGSTTGRPRRCGWFDAHAVRAMAKLGRMNALCITKMDVLAGLGDLEIASGYEGWDAEGLPASHRIYENLKPVYETMAGFDAELAPIKSFEEMPQQVKDFVTKLESFCGVPVKYFSTGPATDELVLR